MVSHGHWSLLSTLINKSPLFMRNIANDRIIDASGSIVPASQGLALGSSASRWDVVYLQSFSAHSSGNNISYISGSSSGGIYFSDVEDSVSSGGGKLEYVSSNSRFYFRGVRSDTGALTDGIYMHLSSFPRLQTEVDIWPASTQVRDLGSASLEFDNVYCVSLTESSDGRYKSSIADLDDKSIQLIDSLKPKSYKHLSGSSGRRHVGFLAEDIRDSLDAVGLGSSASALWVQQQEDADGAPVSNGKMALRYSQLLGHLVYYVQALEARISALGG